MSLILRLVLCLSLALFLPADAFAQSFPGPGQPDYGGDPAATLSSAPPLPPVAGLRAGDPRTNDPGWRTVQALRDATAFCKSLNDPAYRIDCLSERMEYIARVMPKTGDYRAAQAAIERAGKRLHAVSKRYADRAKPKQKYGSRSGPRPQQAARPLVPVRRDQAAVANREAAAIIAEAETTLLRSSATAVGQGEQIQNIAAAVASNKVLLRST